MTSLASITVSPDFAFRRVARGNDADADFCLTVYLFVIRMGDYYQVALDRAHRPPAVRVVLVG
jgi:hypothetical protein